MQKRTKEVMAIHSLFAISDLGLLNMILCLETIDFGSTACRILSKLCAGYLKCSHRHVLIWGRLLDWKGQENHVEITHINRFLCKRKG
jgi:hypothetical protein